MCKQQHKMNPYLLFTKAIKRKVIKREIGIIDTLYLNKDVFRYYFELIKLTFVPELSTQKI